jgi:hypothetical protein
MLQLFAESTGRQSRDDNEFSLQVRFQPGYCVLRRSGEICSIQDRVTRATRFLCQGLRNSVSSGIQIRLHDPDPQLDQTTGETGKPERGKTSYDPAALRWQPNKNLNPTLAAEWSIKPCEDHLLTTSPVTQIPSAQAAVAAQPWSKNNSNVFPKYSLLPPE